MDGRKNMSFLEQKDLKLRLEDEIPKFLDGETRRLALEFAAYLRANKMQPSWQSTNSWKSLHKGQNVCVIRLLEGSWRVVPRISRWNKLINSYDIYEKELGEAGLKEIVAANVNHCRSCAGCAPGWKISIFETEHENVCHNVPVWYKDPGEAELNCVRTVLELMKRTIGCAK